MIPDVFARDKQFGLNLADNPLYFPILWEAVKRLFGVNKVVVYNNLKDSTF